MYFLSFRIFEQLAFALKEQSCPEIINCIDFTFYIPDFEQLALALKNGGCPEYTVLNMYFLLFRIFEQHALALKFFTVLNVYFLSFRMFEQLALALKNRVAMKISKPGGAAAPPDPASYAAHVCKWWESRVSG